MLWYRQLLNGLAFVSSPNMTLPFDPALDAKVALLRSSALFSPRNGGDPLVEKEMLFLTLAGAKPISGVGSSHWIKTHSGGRAAPDDPAEVEDLFQQLGLAYEIEVRESVTLAYISLEATSLTKFLAARNDHRESGRWFGYPMTAVDAFMNGTLMEPAEQEAAIIEFGLPVFSTFRLSREHAMTEIEVMRQWWELLDCYDLVG